MHNQPAMTALLPNARRSSHCTKTLLLSGHLTGEETEAHGDEVTCPRSHTWKVGQMSDWFRGTERMAGNTE